MQGAWWTEDVASLARCSGATVTRAVQRGELRAKRNGRRLLFDPAEAKRWARQRQKRQATR